mmetsp:Transcript_6437/g.11188  ORF Transcript_6437/g.11188 Transcript_6437/m.11188 type:complete len:87 (-) Transcript_6437:803-1063(-)
MRKPTAGGHILFAIGNGSSAPSALIGFGPEKTPSMQAKPAVVAGLLFLSMANFPHPRLTADVCHMVASHGAETSHPCPHILGDCGV